MHIKNRKLKLKFSKTTRSDGNCWFDAISDQVIVHNIPNIPRNHEDLRKAVCDAMLVLPENKSWIENIFDNKKKAPGRIQMVLFVKLPVF